MEIETLIDEKAFDAWFLPLVTRRNPASLFRHALLSYLRDTMEDAGCNTAHADISRHINRIDTPVADKQRISAHASETLNQAAYEQAEITFTAVSLSCGETGKWPLKEAIRAYFDALPSEMLFPDDMEETELSREKIFDMCEMAQHMALERGYKLFEANQRVHELEQELRQKREAQPAEIPLLFEEAPDEQPDPVGDAYAKSYTDGYKAKAIERESITQEQINDAEDVIALRMGNENYRLKWYGK